MYQVGQSLIEKFSVEAPTAAQCIMNGSLAQHTAHRLCEWIEQCLYNLSYQARSLNPD